MAHDLTLLTQSQSTAQSTAPMSTSKNDANSDISDDMAHGSLQTQNDSHTVTLSNADYTLLKKLQVLRSLIGNAQEEELDSSNKHSDRKSKGFSQKQPSELQPLDTSVNGFHAAILSPASLLSLNQYQHNAPTVVSGPYSSASSSSASSAQNIPSRPPLLSQISSTTIKGRNSTSEGSHSSTASMHEVTSSSNSSSSSHISNESIKKALQDSYQSSSATNSDAARTDSGYTYEKFCENLDVNNDYVLKLLELLIKETVQGNSPNRSKVATPRTATTDTLTNRRQPHHDSNDLDDYFAPSPVIEEFVDYDRAAYFRNSSVSRQSSQRRMLAQAITNNAYIHNSMSPGFSPTSALEPLSISSSLSNSPSALPLSLNVNPPPIDIGPSRALSQHEIDEDEHWQRQYARRLRREQERKDSTAPISSAAYLRANPSSYSSLSSTMTSSYVSSRPSSRGPPLPDGHSYNHREWVPTTQEELDAVVSHRNMIWDTYNDPSLEGLTIQSINGVSLSDSWDD